MSRVFPPEMIKKGRLSSQSFPGYSMGHGAGQNQIWILQSHLWASWVQNQTTDIAHIATAPHAPGDNYCWVSPPIPSHAAELARAKGMRADVLPPDRCQLCPMENVIWDEWEPASSQTGLCGMVVGPPHGDHYPFQQPPLSWQTPATAFHKNIISALPLVCKLEKVKRVKDLHENQKNAQVNRREVEKCGKEMYIHRGWRGKVYLRADSPEEIHKSQNKWFVTAMFWGMWLRVLNSWG